MNKYVKVFSIIALMVFSFYYTEKVALYVQNNTPLKKEIIVYKENNKIDYVDAVIEGNYIVPGINGLEINVDKSYNQMKMYNVFSEKNLVYDEVKPEISVSNYKNKIIRSGNKIRNGVSILISNNNINIDYLKFLKINYDLVTNNDYCIKFNQNSCKGSKQIVEPTIILSNNNFLKNIDEINKGYIIYLDDNLNKDYIYYLIKKIEYSGYNIYKLKDHLSENYEL